MLINGENSVQSISLLVQHILRPGRNINRITTQQIQQIIFFFWQKKNQILRWKKFQNFCFNAQKSKEWAPRGASTVEQSLKCHYHNSPRRVWIESITRWAIKRGRSTKPGAAPPGGRLLTRSLAVLEWVQRPRRVAGEEGGMSANSSACCQRWMIAVNICAAEQQTADWGSGSVNKLSGAEQMITVWAIDILIHIHKINTIYKIVSD